MRANTKADIKKCPAFVKKLSAVSEDKKSMLMRDFKGLNLTKYIAEAIQAVADASLKTKEILSVFLFMMT